MAEIKSREKVNQSFSENALKMMRKRYLLIDREGNQETPFDMFLRVAKTLAEVERDYGRDAKFVRKTQQEFFEIMVNKEFTPAGRTLTNAGSTTPLVANCIVLPIEDSMEGIFQTLKEAALLQQAGAGLGFSLDRLRPAMSPTIKSRGVASGPVSFLKIYNEAFGVIKQQGRHGANMAMMSVDHPDILDFIRAKEIEGEIRNFNISVKVTDQFMEAVINRPNEPWYCTWQGEKVKPRRILRHPNGSVYGFEELDITAKELFDEIVNYAWTNGEPGIVFIDTVNKTNPLPGLGPIETSNPCVTGDTLVPTEQGFLRMDELARFYGGGGLRISIDSRVPRRLTQLVFQKGSRVAVTTNKLVQEERPITILNESVFGDLVRAWSTGVKPVWRLTTRSGYELKATGDHKIFTPQGKVPLQALKRGDKVLIQNSEGVWSKNYKLPFEVKNEIKGKNGRIYRYNLPQFWTKELGEVLGWLIGDGWLRDKEKEEAVGFTFAKEDEAVMTYLERILNTWNTRPSRPIKRHNGVYHLIYQSRYFVSFFKNLGVKTVKAGEKELPAALWRAPREAIIGFLRGLFSADGTVQIHEKNQTRYIRLTSKSEKLLKQVQILLINLGIKSTIYNRSRGPRNVLGYEVDGVLFELQISKDNILLFLDKVGFLGEHYEARVRDLRAKAFYGEYFEDEIRNIEFLGEEEVFDLTEAVSHSFVANGIVVSNCGEQFLHPYDNCNLGSINLAVFVRNGQIDYERLKKVTRIAVRLMDNVIDRFDFPVAKVTELAKKNRRIGLGIMGFADMLYQLGIKYNSEEGLETAEKVMATIGQTAHEMSQELAKEKGVFPNWKQSIFAKKKVKMRNAALTTVAPTGSISMMFDTSSGIEPNFALAYVKQDKDGERYHYLNRYFEEELRRRHFSESEIAAIKEEVLKTGSIQHLASLPQDLRDTFVISMDMSGEDHVRMQAAFQKQVDNSISKTINFPNSATREDIGQSYILAWQLGCKSCTVYRDGSRMIQILNIGEGEKITAANEDPKRKKAVGRAVETAIGSLVPKTRPGVLEGKTYRLRTGYGKLYVTINNDERGLPFEVFATIGKSGGFFQEQSEAICRLVSLALRSGIKVEEIIDNLRGIRGPMPVMTENGTVLSLPDAIGRVLEEHIQNLNDSDRRQLAEVPVAESRPAEEETEAGKNYKSIADLGLMPGCPDCGSPLKMAEGCISCPNCGYSRCL